MSDRSKHPLVAGILSFLFPGAGQVYNENFFKGIIILIIFVLSLASLIHSLFDLRYFQPGNILYHQHGGLVRLVISALFLVATWLYGLIDAIVVALHSDAKKPIIDKSVDSTSPVSEKGRSEGKIFLGVVLILIGLMVFLSQFGVDLSNFTSFGILLAVLGAYILARSVIQSGKDFRLEKISLSGAGLGIYLVLLGLALVTAPFSNYRGFLEIICKLYPFPLILLGMDYLIFHEKKISRHPDNFVVVLVIMITFLGLIGNFVPRSFFFGAPYLREDFYFRQFFDHRLPLDQEEKIIEEEFLLTDGLNEIIVKNGFGSVEIIGGNENRIKVRGVFNIQAKDSETIEAYEKNIKINGEYLGNRMKINIIKPQPVKDFSLPEIKGDLYIEIPDDLNVEIENSFGDVYVKDIAGSCKVKNSHGRIEIEGLSGNGVINNTFDDVKITSVMGDLEVDVKNGDFEGEKIQGNITVKNSFGRVWVRNVSKDTKINGQNSDVKLEKVAGLINLENSFGDVRITDCQSNIKVNLNNGDLDVKTSRLGGDYRLEVKFGNIELDIPEDAGFELEARTSFGKIDSDFPVNMEEKTGEMLAYGTVKEGGPDIILETKNGDIEIK